MADAKDIIGEAGVKALADAGFTVTPPTPKPKEPALIVTMGETRERFIRHQMGEPYPCTREKAEEWWLDIREIHDALNAADDWLVKAANRRLIEGLPRYRDGYVWINGGMVHVPSALRLFCGEGA